MNKIIHIILISLFSLTIISCNKDDPFYSVPSTDTTAPVIAEVYPVTTPTSDPSPNYTFSSTKAGTITYGGSCSSGTTSATSGNNTITFLTLSAGTYSDCTIIVTDSDGNASNSLAVTTFVVDTTTNTDKTAPTVTSVSTTADNQSSVSITDNITVTFSEAMDSTYVTTNTSDTYCSGTLRVSSDNFSTCVKMSSSPASSNSDKTFTVDPSDNLSYSTTYKIRVTTGVKDSAGNTLGSQYETSSGFTTFSDNTAPTISSISPTDNSYDVSFSTAIAVTFSETMSTSTITTNTDNTTCSGSFQLSSNNFATCIRMSAAPTASNSDKTFSSTPAENLSRGTNYKLQITTSAKDTSSNSLADNYTTTNGFTTYGTGTIKGTVRYDNNTTADNVSVSFAKSGTIVNNITNEDNGTYTQDNLSLGSYTISFTKSGFNDASMLATLATDNQTVNANVTLLANTCSAGTVSGKITDAVTSANVNNASINVRSGLNVTSGSTTGTTTTATNGTYTLSSMSAGGYTVEVNKSGYITTYFNVNVCGKSSNSFNMSNQNASVSENLSSGSMRIVLTWPTGSTARDLDTHLQIPDNASGQYHIYYSKKVFYYATNSSTSSGSDKVTLDRDTTTAPGTETITITKVRSGTYSFSVHDYTNKSTSSSTKLAKSGASVKVYYNNTTTTFNVLNSPGTLWRVFTFTNSAGLRATNTITHQSTPGNVY